MCQWVCIQAVYRSKNFLHLRKQGALYQEERRKTGERRKDAGVVGREKGNVFLNINGMDRPKNLRGWEWIFQGGNWPKKYRLNLKMELWPWNWKIATHMVRNKNLKTVHCFLRSEVTLMERVKQMRDSAGNSGGWDTVSELFS